MDFLKSRMNLSAVRQAPTYDDVVWSASYQTSGSARRHCDKDFTSLVLCIEPSPKSAAKARRHTQAAIYGPLSARPVSRQSLRSDRPIKSARSSRQVPVLRKGLSSPAIFMLPTSVTEHGNSFMGKHAKRDQQQSFSALCPGKKLGALNAALASDKQRADLNNGVSDEKINTAEEENVIIGHFNMPDQLPVTLSAVEKQETPKYTDTDSKGGLNASVSSKRRLDVSKSFSRHKQSAEEGRFRRKSAPGNISTLRQGSAKVPRPQTPVRRLKDLARADSDSDSSSECSSDLDNYFDNDNKTDATDNDCFAHLTWDRANNDSRTESSQRASTPKNFNLDQDTKLRRRSTNMTLSAKSYRRNSYDRKTDNCTNSNTDASEVRRKSKFDSRHRSSSSYDRRERKRSPVSDTGNSSRISWDSDSSKNCRSNSRRSNRKQQARRATSSDIRRISSASPLDRSLTRLEMQRRFSTEAWYQKALNMLKELPAHRSKVKDDYTDDPEETAKRLCRPTASSRAREAATDRVVVIDREEKEKKPTKQHRKSVVVDFVYVEDMLRFKGQKHVTCSEMQDIVRRLSECSPKQVPEAQRIISRENMNRVGIMNTSYWRGENRFQKESINRINVENLIRDLGH